MAVLLYQAYCLIQGKAEKAQYKVIGCKEKDVTELRLPSIVTGVEPSAFMDLVALRSIQSTCEAYISQNGILYDRLGIVCCPRAYEFPRTNDVDPDFHISSRVYSIGDYAFYAVKNLNSISLCSDSVVLSSSLRSELNTVSEIGTRAFSYSALAGIQLPNSLQRLGAYAFAGCKQLLTADLSATQITTLEAGTFKGCSLLSEVKLPATLKVISRDAFRGCKRLGVIRIPASVECIMGHAFDECDGIRVIFEPNTQIAQIGVPETVWNMTNHKKYSMENLIRGDIGAALMEDIFSRDTVHSLEGDSEVIDEYLRRMEGTDA